MFKTSETITEISKALLSVQNEFLAIKKEAKGKHNKYADYSELIKKCKPVLTNAGIVLIQPVTYIVAGASVLPSISTRLIHAETGEFYESTSIVTPMTERKNTSGDPILSSEQRVGGGITYQKRYDLVCMLSWATGEYDLDQGDLDEQDKKTKFIMKSFEDLLSKSGVEEDFSEKVIEGVSAIPEINKKKAIYAQLMNVILPKAKEDILAAERMLNDAIREAS